MIHLENKTIAFAWELSDEILKAIEEGQVPDKIDLPHMMVPVRELVTGL